MPSRRAVAVLDREQVPWVIIGKGSNLLVADGGYRGAVISLGREFQRTVVADDGCTLTVGAGVMFARLVNDALSRSLSGLEFAVDPWFGRRCDIYECRHTDRVDWLAG